MKYILLALTLSCAAGYAFADEANDNNDIDQNDEALNLEEGNSSNYWLNWGTYGRGGLGYGLGYGYGFGNCCGRNLSYNGIGFSGPNWGFYNQFYLFRSPPAVYAPENAPNMFYPAATTNPWLRAPGFSAQGSIQGSADGSYQQQQFGQGQNAGTMPAGAQSAGSNNQ